MRSLRFYLHRRTFVLAVCTSSSLSVSCTPQVGGLAAMGTGQLSRPLAERRPPDSDFLSSCGDGRGLIPGSVARKPYVQQTTPDGAIIALGSASEAPVTVDVTTPAGKPVLSVEATVDARGRGELTTLAAQLTGLSPSTVYCYALRGLTEPAGFASAPRSPEPVRFIAFGDSGSGSSNQRTLMGEMETVPFEMVLHLGDLAYESGRPEELEARYFQVYEPISRSFPVYPVAGNHDYGTNEAQPLRDAFVLPTNGGELGSERWYSFDRGDVHFVALDTERIGPEQAAWLEQDLAQNQRPWKVVFGHRPPFSSGEHGGSAEYRSYFVPLLQKHAVDLVLSGHEHDYERFRPIDGVTYVVSGGGGRELREVGWGPLTAYAEPVVHFVYVDVSGTTLTMHAIDGVGREFDQAVVHHAH